MRRGVFGHNSGNYLFSDSVFRLLSTPDAEVVPDSFLTAGRGVTDAYVARVNEQFDAYVLPMANSFRDTFVPNLGRLTDTITKLKIPVVVTGVGAQLTFEQGIEASNAVDAATTAFVSAVLDRSAKIGVRGETTRRYLARLGFGDEHVEVIGCPSIYLRGPDYAVRPPAPIDQTSRIGLNIATHIHDFGPFVTRMIEQYDDLTYVAQTIQDLNLLLWGVERLHPGKRPFPVHLDHPLIKRDRVKFFLDSRTWVDYLADFDYMIGTRIHGNVAALLGGTPATMIAIDSRTAELAEYHEIPMFMLSELAADDDVRRVYERSDWAAYNKGLGARYEVLTSFLSANGLAHIGAPGLDNPAFDEALAAVRLPEPVGSLVTPDGVDAAALLARLRWLRQGEDVDAKRKVGAFAPEFPLLPAAPARPATGDGARSLRRVVKQLFRR